MSKHTNIEQLIKAQQVFERFRVGMVNDRDQAGAAKAFEFCYELSWKMMRRVLKMQRIIKQKGICVTPRDTFHEAALAKLMTILLHGLTFKKNEI